MATIVAVRSGNWSNTSHVTGPWPGASTPTTKPASGDTVQTDAYIVTIDENVTVAQLEATSSGRFDVSATRTITGNLVAAGTYTSGALRCTHTGGSTVTFIGNVAITSATANVKGINNSSTGTLAVTGNMTGTGGSGQGCLYNASSGTINLTGTVSGSSVFDSNTIWNNSTGTIAVTGDVSGASGPGAFNIGTGTIEVTGNVFGAGVNGYGVRNNGTGTVTVSGTATGGTGAGVYGVYNGSTGTVTVKRAKGGSGLGAAGLYGANSGGVTTFKELEFGSNGCSPVAGFVKMVIDQAVNLIVVKRSDTGADYSMSNDYPAVGDVKNGVVYNRTTMTGTYSASGVIVIED